MSFHLETGSNCRILCAKPPPDRSVFSYGVRRPDNEWYSIHRKRLHAEYIKLWNTSVNSTVGDNERGRR